MRLMEGKRRSARVNNDGIGDIKKGPWKSEEDEVLINHVRKYGPRDWSSIRSKGLLQRTGKSCRLRWVNKLRPNLKNGVKFSADEERTVIELQEKFGNKWARIATFLPGRTDNDVKNFWSSRQKRLARLLHHTGTSSGRPSKNTKMVQAPALQQVPSFMEAPEFCASNEEESQRKSQSSSISHQGNSETIKTVTMPELLHPTYPCYEQTSAPQNYSLPEKKPFADRQFHLSFPHVLPEKKPFADPRLHLSFPQISPEKKSLADPQLHLSFPQISPEKKPLADQQLHLSFPQISPEKKPLADQQLHLSFPQISPEKKLFGDPQLHLSFPQISPEKKPFADTQLHFFPQISLDFPMPSFGDPSYLDAFGHASGSVQFPVMPSFFGPDRNCFSGAEQGQNAVVQDTFTDDFPPIDIFDPIEPLPSPSEWS